MSAPHAFSLAQDVQPGWQSGHVCDAGRGSHLPAFVVALEAPIVLFLLHLCDFQYESDFIDEILSQTYVHPRNAAQPSTDLNPASRCCRRWRAGDEQRCPEWMLPENEAAPPAIGSFKFDAIDV